MSLTAPGRLAGLPGRLSRRAARRLFRGFRKNRDGATAIEFGIVAAPFFALLFAILETALVFWTTQVLETAVADASRQIYTGQFQQDPANAGQTPAQLAGKFKTLICNSVVALFDCPSMLHVDVKTFPNFAGSAVPPPVNNGAFDTAGFGYQPPGSNQIVVVRAAMEYPIFVTLLNSNQHNLSNGKRLIMASSTFRTEPFGP